MDQPVITLLTDFGTADHFVGVMKGVILRICPNARIVDITHEVRPFEIQQGAFLLHQAWSYFPDKTIHVAIVDPGVGSDRRPVLVSCHGHYFIGPDNGLLSRVYWEQPHKVREITATKYFLPLSQTFHGRDVFAPVAAHLGTGVKPSRFGKLIDNHCKLASYEPQRTSKRAWSGTIVHIDRFGNLVTNFHIDRFSQVRLSAFELSLGPRRIHQLARIYAEAPAGELVAVVGSSGYLEIAANQASAAAISGVGIGAPCDLALF